MVLEALPETGRRRCQKDIARSRASLLLLPENVNAFWLNDGASLFMITQLAKLCVYMALGTQMRFKYMTRLPLMAGFCIAILGNAAIGIGSTQAADYKSEYSLTVLGLNVGKSKFSTTINDKSYKISGSLNASGVAKLFADTSGSLTASGSIGNNKITANAFDVRYKDGKKSKRTTLGFSGGNVSQTANSPKLKKKGDWVEVEKAQLRNVLDPISAILVPASSMRDVCTKTLKVFDGAMRADFQMRYLRTIPFSAKGYKGDAVTCRASFKPIAGYDRKKKDLVWMRDKGNIEVSFAPVGNTGLYAPVAAKIGTRIGTATIRARRFEALTK